MTLRTPFYSYCKYLYKGLFLAHIIFTANFSYAQHTLAGRVVDMKTGIPLAFVSIVYNHKGQGVTTGLDGGFEISTSQPVRQLRIHYLGYSPLTLSISSINYSSPVLVGLEPTAYNIEEVKVTPGVNPAHRIINEVFRNRKANDPEQLNSFQYTSYNKAYFTFSRDTSAIRNNPDTLELAQDSVLLSPLERKIDGLKRRQHVMLMESVTERSFLSPASYNENVLGARFSGNSDPWLAGLLSQLQPLSFHSEHISIMEAQYLNPISKGSTSNYLFILEDTLFTPSFDTLFVISFRPLRNRTFAGLKGVMTINTNGYAIQNVIAEPTSLPPSTFISMRIQQRYEQVDGAQWFPKELNSDIIYNMPVTFITDTAKGRRIPIFLVGANSSYINDVRLNPTLKSRDFGHVEVSFLPQSGARSDEFWAKNRRVLLSEQEERTYRVMDSLGLGRSNDRLMMGLINGKIPIYFIDIDLNSIVQYNDFEGWRLGMGLETNRRVMEKLFLGGYYAHGFKDGESKYGGSLRWEMNRAHQVALEGKYEHDVREPGEFLYSSPTGYLDMDMLRNFMIWRMDYINRYTIRLSSRVFKFFQVGLTATNCHFNVASGYGFQHTEAANPYVFSTSEVGGELRFARKETYIYTPTSILPNRFELPMLRVNYYRGVKVLGNSTTYNRFGFRFDHRVRYRTLGHTSFSISGGFLHGDVPTPLLHFSPGALGNYPVFAPNSFSTMGLYEFVADRYAYAFIRHNFERVSRLKTTFFIPELEFVYNLGVGSYNQDPAHLSPENAFNSIPKGYHECGLVLNGFLPNQFYSMGLGAFYRLGYYAHPKWEDNITINLTISFKL